MLYVFFFENAQASSAKLTVYKVTVSDIIQEIKVDIFSEIGRKPVLYSAKVSQENNQPKT